MMKTIAGTGRVSLPGYISGWGSTQYVNNTCKNTENIRIRGAQVTRVNVGGRYLEGEYDIPIAGVLTNITVHTSDSPPGTATLQGMAVLTADGSGSDLTTLKGRWVATSPAGIPVSREIRAMTPDLQASAESITVSGHRDIQEMGYSRSDTVDVQ